MKIEIPSRIKVSMAVGLAAVIIVAVVYLGMKSGGISEKETGAKYAGPAEKITLGVATMEICSLIYIADALGLFKDYGLDATLIDYQAGSIASDDLLKNKVDVATAAEFVFVLKSFKHDDLRILASIVRADTHEVIARRDRGISRPADLKGKRMALTRQTSGDFFKETFLAFHGIPSHSVEIVDRKPYDIAEAISSGTVDAVMTWEPHAGRIKDRLGSNAISWPGQSGQHYYMVLVTREEFVRKRPGAVERLIKALLAAERFVSENPAKAQDMIEHRLNYDHAILQSSWQRCDFRVRLDQDLLILMEDEARWAIRHKVTMKEMPNYFKSIDLESLQKIKPEAVSIIH